MNLPAARSPAIEEAIAGLSQVGIEERGAIFTRAPVVEAMLDLAGYTQDRDLARLRLLEPSFGGGDFLVPAVRRLLRSYLQHGGRLEDAALALKGAVVGVEVHEASFFATAEKLLEALRAEGMEEPVALPLVQGWLLRDDFLLAPLAGRFDVVVGNPPYVRQERIAAPLLQEYRRRYKTLYDRADLYIPFFERCLQLLAFEGRLVFICSNRWQKNRYGGPLRRLIAEGFHLSHYLDMVGTDAFEKDVLGYPGITVLRRGPGTCTRIAHRPALEEGGLEKVTTALLSARPAPDGIVREVEAVARGDAPWLLDSLDQLALVRRIEAVHPTLEEDGCRIGIGVATGADRVFIGPYDALPVEPGRKLPLVKAPDLRSGRIRWGGLGVINPFNASGALVDLDGHPLLRRWAEQNADVLRRRHVARRNPGGWYRTIDRIDPRLLSTPKLLVPDIKGEPGWVYDRGEYYPHHNLYFITSETWDLRALQAILRSSMALMLIGAYSIRMSGGFLRFQAQYLRRIRIPRWSSLSPALRQELAARAEEQDLARLDAVAFAAYGIQKAEQGIASRRVPG